MKKRGPLALIVTLVLAGSVYVVGDRFSWWGSSCDVPQSLAGDRSNAAIAPSGDRGGVYTIDNGSDYRPFDSKARGGGVTLGNNTHAVAYRTRVKFKVDGYPGKPRATRSRSEEFEVTIPFIMPGQHVGVGQNFPGFREINYITAGQATAIWLPRDPDKGPSWDDLGDGFSPPKSSYRGTVHRGSGKPDEIRYTERSKSCQALRSRGTAVVFRNKKGQIVGGDLLKPKGAARPCSPGRHEFRLPVRNKVPPRADDSRTEVYSYCDLNVPKHDVNKRPS